MRNDIEFRVPKPDNEGYWQNRLEEVIIDERGSSSGVWTDDCADSRNVHGMALFHALGGAFVSHGRTAIPGTCYPTQSADNAMH